MAFFSFRVFAMCPRLPTGRPGVGVCGSLQEKEAKAARWTSAGLFPDPRLWLGS